jgi:hypothetical protein
MTSSPPGQGGKSGSNAMMDEPIVAMAGTTFVASGGSSPAQGGATRGGSGPIVAGASSVTAGTSHGSGGRGAINSVCEAAEDCPTDAFCKQGFCACPLDLPDFCPDPDNLPGACVSRQSDPKNCHLCDRACAQGAACNQGSCSGAPTVVASTSECGEMRLVVQGPNLYLSKPLTGEVKAISLAGGDMLDLASLQDTPTQIVADADGVYWVDQGNGTVGSSKVMKKPLPLTDGEPIVLVTSPSQAPLPALAVQGKKLYYALGHDVHAVSTDPAQAGDVIVATATNYDVEPPQPAGDPAALWVTAAGAVCWTTAFRNGVESDGVEAGNDAGYSELAQSVGSLLLSTVYCSTNFAYFANGERLQRSSGLPFDLAQTPKGDAITAFAIGAGSAYFAGQAGAVYRQALDADVDVPPTALAMNQSVVTAIALDDQRVYWATDRCFILSAPQ